MEFTIAFATLAFLCVSSTGKQKTWE